MQPKPASPGETAAVAAPASAKVNVTQPAPATTGSAALITPPAAKPVQTPQTVAATPAPNSPQAELNVIIDGLATMMRSGDVLGMQLKYAPPDERPSGIIPPGKEAQVQAMQQALQQQRADPRMQPLFEAQAQAMESLKDQQPVLNAAGDLATYQLTTPVLTLPDGTSYPARTEPAVFKKIEGKWYVEMR